MKAGCRLRLKVVPGARQPGVEWMGDVLKVKVAAAPEKGRANAAVIELLAQRLQVNAGALSLVSGQTSALKTLDVGGLTIDEIRLRLR